MFERYCKGTAPTVGALAHSADDQLRHEDKWIKNYSGRISIWFQSVWDTVEAEDAIETASDETIEANRRKVDPATLTKDESPIILPQTNIALA